MLLRVIEISFLNDSVKEDLDHRQEELGVEFVFGKDGLVVLNREETHVQVPLEGVLQLLDEKLLKDASIFGWDKLIRRLQVENSPKNVLVKLHSTIDVVPMGDLLEGGRVVDVLERTRRYVYVRCLTGGTWFQIGS